MKIGELAARTGISVRTLHHYDEIGLLSPPHRTAAGHRLYGGDEVARLQQILSLRQLGFPLDEIRTIVDRSLRPDRRSIDTRRVIELHIARLRAQIAMQQELCTRLEAVAAGAADVDEIIKTIEVMTMFEKYYSADQLETLRKRRELLGEQHLREVQEEWPRLMKSVRDEIVLGTDPKDPRVQALAKRWKELIDEFTGGDPGIEQSLRNMYKQQPAAAGQQGLDNELGDYIQRALS